MSRFVALAVIPFAALAAQTPERVTLTGANVSVYNLAGALKVEAGTGPDVVVEITRVGKDGSKLKVENGPIGDVPTLRIIYPSDDIYYEGQGFGRHSSTEIDVRDDGTFGGEGRHHWGGGHVRISSDGDFDGHADLRVLIPAGKRVALHLAVGKADVSNVNGDLIVDVASADVDATGTKGSLKVDAGSGDVRLTNTAGALDIETGSGDVTLNGAGAAAGHVSLDTGSGDVTGDDVTSDELRVETGSGDVKLRGVKAPEARLSTGSGEVEVSLLQVANALDIDTGSGDVTVTLPAAEGGDLYIDTGSGDIDLGGITVQVTKFQKDHIEGHFGTGNSRVKIETGSGDIRLIKG